MSFLHDAWYMAGWSHEVGDGMFARRMLGRPLVFARGEDGAVHALDDKCPHRFAPLSRGRMTGGRIECGYHGLTFDLDGVCVHNPFAERAPPNARVRTYAVAERDSIVWVWMGEAERANPAALPDYRFLNDRPDNRVFRGLTPMRANYMLAIDNLMDLSHIEFIHRGSFGGAGVIFEGQHEAVEESDTVVHSNWMMRNIETPFYARAWLADSPRVDHWLDMRWQAPGALLLKIGFAAPGAPKESGFTIVQAHILTPETETSTHYFYGNVRYFNLGSAEEDAVQRATLETAFNLEDKPMIESLQEHMQGGEFLERPVLLSVDAAAMRVRGAMRRLIEHEKLQSAKA